MEPAVLIVSGVEINVQVKAQGETSMVSIAARRGASSSKTILKLGGAKAVAPAPPCELDLIEVFFQFLDLNSDGRISKTEVETTFPTWSEADRRELFARFDRDCDGYISYEEFVDWVIVSAATANSRVKQPSQAVQGPLAESLKDSGRVAPQTIRRQTVTEIFEDDFDTDIQVANTDPRKAQSVSWMATTKEQVAESVRVADGTSAVVCDEFGKRKTSFEAVGSASGGYEAAEKPLDEVPRVQASAALSMGSIAVSSPKTRRVRKSKLRAAELPAAEESAAEVTVAEVPQQVSALLNINVLTLGGNSVGKFAVKPTAKVKNLKADLVSLCNVDEDQQTLLLGQVILDDASRWIDTSIKDEDEVTLTVERFLALEDATIQQAVDDFCQGGKARDGVERTYGHISRWDTTHVTDMNILFEASCNEAKSRFNEDVNAWNVSNVTNMKDMFKCARMFNGDLSAWDVSNVVNMHRMFRGATRFNGDVSTWNVSNVTDMSYMFCNDIAFNGDLSAWDVSNVTNMAWMFGGAKFFNSDLTAWNVSKVTNMKSMICDAHSFKCNLRNWKPPCFPHGVTREKLLTS